MFDEMTTQLETTTGPSVQLASLNTSVSSTDNMACQVELSVITSHQKAIAEYNEVIAAYQAAINQEAGARKKAAAYKKAATYTTGAHAACYETAHTNAIMREKIATLYKAAAITEVYTACYKVNAAAAGYESLIG